jgi:hypothetical protein
MVSQLPPCPLCHGAAACKYLIQGLEVYRQTTCTTCGAFLVEATLPPEVWTRLGPEDQVLRESLLLYIQYKNRRNQVPLLTLGNWRTLARRGGLRLLSLPSNSDMAL